MRMSLFLRLPIELQEYITKYAVAVENIKTLKLVCKRLKFLVEQVFDHNCLNGKPLLWNLSHKNRQEVERLVRDERIILKANEYGYFTNICLDGDLDLLESVLNDSRIDPMANENRALKQLAHQGRSSRMKLLLTNQRINPDANTVFCLMQSACIQNIPHVLSVLLEKYDLTYGQNNNLLYTSDRCSECLLLLISHRCIQLFTREERLIIYKVGLNLACPLGARECVENILASTSEIIDGNHAFARACKEGQIHIVRLLLQSPMVHIENPTCPFMVAGLNDSQAIKLLFQHPGVSTHFNLSQLAAKVDDLEWVKSILPLLMIGELLLSACKENNLDLVEFLLTYPSITSSHMYNAFLFASQTDNIQMVKILLKHPQLNTRSLFDGICCEENIPILSLLLPTMDVTRLREDLIPFLEERGKTQVIRLLLSSDS